MIILEIEGTPFSGQATFKASTSLGVSHSGACLVSTFVSSLQCPWAFGEETPGSSCDLDLDFPLHFKGHGFGRGHFVTY